MNLQPFRESITVQSEILLNTQGQIFKVGGITLDGSAFPERVVKAGTAVMKDEASGKFVPYADGEGGAFPAGAEIYITAQDSVVRTLEGTVSDNPVGAYIEAYLNTSRLTGVTEAFMTETRSRYIFG